MIDNALKRLWAQALALVLLQIGTANFCFAAEETKTAQQSVDPVAVRPDANTYPDAILSLSSDLKNFSRYALLVDKSKRTLTVWENDGDKIKLVDAVPTDIGSATGDKFGEGDLKTPEGIYFFDQTMDGRKVDYNQYGVRIFTMDYPNYFDRLEKKSGHGIWLHAIPETKTLHRGSRGCVVVRNETIEGLVKYIELKRTPIVIVNHVEYLNEKDWSATRAGLRQWLEEWRQAWGGKDLNKYMDYYSERFRGNHMSKAQWRRYKETLASRYEFINIDLRDVQVFNQGQKAVFRFVQNYKSDQKDDYGSKILYAMKEKDKFEIVGEDWKPLVAPPTNAPVPTPAENVHAARASAESAASPQ